MKGRFKGRFFAVPVWEAYIWRGLFSEFYGIMVCYGIFCCVKEAFDTMGHSILFQKLELYGVSSQTLAWFESYLTGRKQKTLVDDELSDFCTLTCGIPQGSIFYLLFFILHINDLPLCQPYSRPRMYAHDTTLTWALEDGDTLQVKMNSDLTKSRRDLR